jgi:nicotinamidase-related amidase
MQVDTIDPAKAAMIVVDMQNDFVAAGAVLAPPPVRNRHVVSRRFVVLSPTVGGAVRGEIGGQAPWRDH